jgi:hypothetical protein
MGNRFEEGGIRRICDTFGLNAHVRSLNKMTIENIGRLQDKQEEAKDRCEGNGGCMVVSQAVSSSISRRGAPPK